MEFYEVIKCRRSMRGFFDKEIPDAALERIGEAVAAKTKCSMAIATSISVAGVPSKRFQQLS